MAKIFSFLFSLAILGILLTPAAPILASDYGLGQTASAAKLPTGADLPVRVGQVVNAALGILGLLFLILAIYGGFIIMLSQGDSGRVTTGKNTLLWAVIGMIVIASAYALTSFVITRVVQ